MKIFTISLFLISISSFANWEEASVAPVDSTSQSEQSVGESSKTSVNSFYDKGLSLAYAYEKWEYVEFDSRDGSQIMKDSGTLTGPALRYEKFFEKFELFVSAKRVSGDTDYEGALIHGDGSTSPYNTGSENSIMTINFKTGINIHRSTDSMLNLRLGYQYRKLKNPEQASDPYDYTREATYKTIPVGFAYKKFLGDLKLNVEMDYHISFSGETYTQSSDVGGTDKTYIQDDGRGFNALVSLDIPYNTVAFNVSAYYESWKVEDSNLEASHIPGFVSLEPENETKTVGMSAGVLF